MADLRGGNDKESLGNMAGKRKSRAKTTRSILSGHGGGLDAGIVLDRLGVRVCVYMRSLFDRIGTEKISEGPEYCRTL